MTSKIRPATIRNRILWVLGQHGIEQTTALSIWHSLTTGSDPRPSNIPASFRFQGVELTWPSGVGTRLLVPNERRTLNRALRRNNNDVLDDEDNALAGRKAYQALWNKTQQPDYVDPTTPKALTAALLQDAMDEGVLDGSDKQCGTPLSEAHNECNGTHVLCWHQKPGGRLRCTLDDHHDGLHTVVGHKDKPTWSDTEVVIQHHIPQDQPVTHDWLAQRNAELDKLEAILNTL